MANRRHDVTLSEIVSTNIKRVCVDFDISTRDLASRVGTSSQKSIWNLLNEEHSPTLKTLEPVFRALMISPAAAMTPSIDTSLLVSRKLPRLIEKYARMSPTQRDKFEDIIDSILLD